jgi:hypothetical protein
MSLVVEVLKRVFWKLVRSSGRAPVGLYVTTKQDVNKV